MVRCPSCSFDNADASRFCASCATPLKPSRTSDVATQLLPAPGAGTAVGVRLSSTSTVDEGRFLPGTVISGRYRLGGLLGRGGMGEVYRATDLTLGQPVALKFLPEATTRDDRALARFYNEVRVARQVTHPNVCRVYDIGEVDGLRFISMEYVDGEDLASLLRRIGRLPADKAVETARKLCAGLAAAHEKGVLHRDLKPANIMLDGRGNVLIMDFGLAGLADRMEGDVRSGTPAYMSPEQLAGKEVTARSDIYALGLVLYEIFTGRRAFEADNLMELMRMQERAAPVSISSVVKDLDPAVERVVLRCLDPDPARRPSSALAVAAALPGGDPLAAALAAGETPSPELVAAAGEMEGLKPLHAAAWLAGVIVALVVVVVMTARLSLLEWIPFDNPPEALAYRAQGLIRRFGYTRKPMGRASGWRYDTEFRAYLKKHPDMAAARWRQAASSQPPLVQFWHRESPQYLAAVRGYNTMVGENDPPGEVSGMVSVRLDPAGKLLAFEAVPPQMEEASARTGKFDFAALFAAAGLDMARFRPAEPRWSPLAQWDERAAWTGTAPGSLPGSPETPLRVEAAAWRGKPVYFHIVWPWTVPSRMEKSMPPSATDIGMLIVLYVSLVAACIMTWLHHRAGRLDRRGALYLGVFIFLGMWAAALLRANHVPSVFEFSVFWRATGVGMINSAVFAVFYLALEPWVRRYWPHTLVDWGRLLAAGPRDPLAGRALLYGVAGGLLLAIIRCTKDLMVWFGGEPRLPDLDALMGFRRMLGTISGLAAGNVSSCLLFFFVLFLLRALLRKQWLAAGAFCLLFGLLGADSAPFAATYAGAVVAAAVYVTVVLRFGLLTLMVASAVAAVLEAMPLTMEPSAWYSSATLCTVAAVLATAIWGYRAAVAGRPAVRRITQV